MYQRTNSVIPLSLFRLTFETANTGIVQRTQEGVTEAVMRARITGAPTLIANYPGGRIASCG